MATKQATTPRARGWAFTLNNPLEFRPAFNDTIKYLCYQLEQGDNETPHLQGYIYYNTLKSLKQLQEYIPGGHFEIAKGTPEQNKNYCSKPGALEPFVEFGEIPNQGKRTDLSEVITAVREKRPREEYIYTDAYVKYFKGIEHVKLMTTTPFTAENVRGTWIYGPPGVGKSHHVRTKYPNVFIKQQNKWWDGYDQQTEILLDDFDRNGVCLGHYLKIWADKWAATGEFKGGTLNLLYNKFFITSNYSIDDLFYEDSVLCEAIKRRFNVIHLVFQTDNLDI